MAKDPICGMYVEETEGALKTVVRGQEYYFCSETCMREFLAPELEFKNTKAMTALSFALGIPTLILTWMSILPPSIPTNLVLFLLATPVQFVAGWRFYRGMLHAIRARSANMDTLIATGTTAAWTYSTIDTFLPGFLPPATYYEVSALIIAFILLGRTLEHSLRRRASDAIRKLLELQPTTARLLRDGVEVEVPIEEVKVGDVVVVKPGDRVPVDGVIIEGSSYVDEKMITGESMPVAKYVGDEVIGGTINLSGVLKVRATKVGTDTVLAQIVKIVEEAQASKAPVERLADKVSAYFVPIVVTIAIASFLFWYVVLGEFLRGLTSFIAVLIVACPCALGLATPAAIVVGTGKGAENGVLIKGGEVIERMARIDTVVFDKTGTLTVGEPSVTEVVTMGSIDEAELIRYAASAEKMSQHPIAQAIVRRCEELGIQILELERFEEFPGEGVVAQICGKRVLVGNQRLFERFGVPYEAVSGLVNQMSERGETVAMVGIDGQVVGVIAVSDRPKANASEAIGELKRMGFKVVMLTGDNERTANAIARSLGIDEVVAHVRPDEKVKVIKSLQDSGRKVVMVGDGINDAPALAQADVGIAIGSGTDVAIESGNVVLISDDLRDVVGALRLGRATIRKVKQNLIWAFLYNTALIPVAASGFLNPILAGIAMAMSSISVVSNSLTLKRLRWR